MPTILCPRCQAQLREEDWETWRLPFSPAHDRSAKNVLRINCWSCTWAAEWWIDEVTEPEKELA